MSPTPAVFCSSCAWNLRVRRTTFLYLGWILITSTWTTIVFSPLSETTMPRRSWRAAGVVSGFGVRVMRLRWAGFSRAGFECLWRSERGRRFLFRLGCSSAGASASGCSATGVSSDGVSVCVSSTASSPVTAAPADSVPESLASAICPLFTNGQNSCDLAPLQLQLRGVLELPGRRLEPEVEQLLSGVGEAAVELVVRQVAQVLSQQRDHRLHGARTSS